MVTATAIANTNIDVVWGILSDLKQWPDFQTHSNLQVQDIDLFRGEFSTGSRCTFILYSGSSAMCADEEGGGGYTFAGTFFDVTKYKFSFDASGLVTLKGRFELEKLKPNETKITYSLDAEGFLWALISFCSGDLVEENVEQGVKELKRVAEESIRMQKAFADLTLSNSFT